MLRALALDDRPGHVGEVRDDLDVAVGVVRGLVANPNHRHDQVRAENRRHQLARDGGVSLGQPLAMGKRGVVVVDDRLSPMQAIRPDTSLFNRGVTALPFRRTELLHSSRGPGLKGERVLVWLDKVVETDWAAGQYPEHVQRLLQQLFE